MLRSIFPFNFSVCVYIVTNMEKAISLVLISLTTIQAYLVCEYFGDDVMSSSQLTDVKCDIMVIFKKDISDSVSLAFTKDLDTMEDTPSDHVTSPPEQLGATHSNISTVLYFGVRLCSTQDINSTDESHYVTSVEKAVEWTKTSVYSGMFVDLCEVNDHNQKVANLIMKTVQIVALRHGLKYGFGLVGKSEGFDMLTYQKMAEFISVTIKEVVYGHQTWEDYNMALNVTATANHWQARGANVSRLVFNVKPYLMRSSTESSVDMSTAPNACAVNSGNTSDVVDKMYDMVIKLAKEINTHGMKGVFLQWIDWDDFEGKYCRNGTSPLTRALRTALNNQS